jgi:dipeptidyl aminopeptidase/acylaminoacyl peptidase
MGHDSLAPFQWASTPWLSYVRRFSPATLVGLTMGLCALFHSSYVLAAQDSYFNAPSVSDIASIGYVNDFTVAPDGRSFAYEFKGGIFTATLSKTEGPLRRADGTRPRWSPDGHSIAFYCTFEEGLQICLLDVQSGGIRRLTHLKGGIVRELGIEANGTPSLDIAWSPDSGRIAFATKPIPVADPKLPPAMDLAQPQVFSGEQDRDPLTHLPGFPMTRSACDSPHTYENFTSGSSCGFTQVFIADVRTGMVKQVTQDQEHHFYPIWSLDSKLLWCVTVPRTRRSRLQLPRTQIAKVDLVADTENVVVPRSEAKIRPRLSPDGKMIAFEQGGSGEYLPWSLVVMTTAGKTIVDTRKLIDRNVADFAWTSDSKAVILNIRDGVRRRLVRLSIGTQTISHIPLQTNWVAGFGSGPNNMIAFIAEDEATVNEVRATYDDGGHVQPVLKISPQTADWKLGKHQIVHWSNSRGEKLEGVLLLPTSFAPDQTYPLIVDMLGYQSCDCFQRDRWDANQLLAEHGYAIFYPIQRPVHYPFWFTMGDEFHRFAGVQQGNERMVDDVTTGLAELIRRGVARRDRVGLMGFSVAANGALQMAIHSDLFSCVVAAGTVYGDWSRHYLLFSDAVDLRSRIGGKTLWDAPDLYRELSIVYNLNRIKAPVLLLVGDQDSGAVEESVEIYNGLRELGMPVQLVRYPNQGHQILGASLDDYWVRVVDFFDRHLKKAEDKKAPKAVNRKS